LKFENHIEFIVSGNTDLVYSLDLINDEAEIKLWRCSYKDKQGGGAVYSEKELKVNFTVGGWRVTNGTSNGVDNQGKALNFTGKDLQPFDRVVTDHGTYIVAFPNEKDKPVLVGRTGWVDGNELFSPEYDLDCEFAPKAVYSRTLYRDDLFKHDELGELRWSREALKSGAFIERCAFFQQHIDAVRENLESLEREFEEFKAA
jgi:hypothetical protein